MQRSHELNGEKTMKQFVGLGLGLLTGVFVGAAMVTGLHAQSKSPAYVVGEITVTNPQAYGKEYAPKAQAIVKAAGGRVIALGGAGGAGSTSITTLEGRPPQRAVIIEFPSMEAINAWWNGPAYKKARAIGDKYATFRDFAVSAAHLVR